MNNISAISTSSGEIFQIKDSLARQNIENETNLRIQADSELSTLIKNKIEALDMSQLSLGADETIQTISEENGVVSASKQKISITQSQVTNLTQDLNNRVLTSSFETWKNNTGLSAAGTGSDNQVALIKDIKDLQGAMHFIGVATISGEETAQNALVRTFPTAKKGDVALVNPSSQEFIYVGDTAGVASSWREIGQEGVYLTKAEFNTWNTDTYTADKTAINNTISSVSSDLQAEIESSVAGLEALVSEVEIEKQRAIGVETSISGKINNLSSNVNTLSADVKKLSDSSILSVKLNGFVFDLVNNVASLDISSINCGGASI